MARAAFDPTTARPDKGSLINNITTSAKETAQSGAEFMLPLCNLVRQSCSHLLEQYCSSNRAINGPLSRALFCHVFSSSTLSLHAQETLAILGITPQELKELCCVCTTFVGYVIDQVYLK